MVETWKLVPDFWRSAMTEIRITRPGSRVHTMVVPKARVGQIIEECRLLGWEVSW